MDQEAASENKEHVQYSAAGYSFGNPEKICRLSCLQKERSIAACPLQFCLANGVSIENVAKMLGHSNIKMTQHYARVLDSSILKDMNNVRDILSNCL